MLAIFSRIKMRPRQIWAVVLFVLFSTTSQMMIPTLVSSMINNGVSGNNQGLIIRLALIMVGLAIFACAMTIFSARISARITTSFSADLRKEVFHKVQTFSAAEIDKFGTSSLITRNTTDVTQIQTFLSMVFRVGLIAPMMTAVGLALCIATAGKVSIVLVFAIPVLIVGITLLTIAASRYSVKLRVKIDKINQLFLEALEGVRVIRAFNRQSHEINRFKETNDETADISRKSITMSSAVMPIVTMIFGLTSIGAMIVSRKWVTTKP